MSTYVSIRHLEPVLTFSSTSILSGLDAEKRGEEGDWQPNESHPERWTVKETDGFLFTLDTTGRLAIMSVD